MAAPKNSQVSPSVPTKSPASKTIEVNTAVKKAVAQKSAAKKTALKAPPSKAVEPAKLEKSTKAKKPKQVRDSFTIPKTEYLVLDELKQRAVKLTRPAKKSEILRAGIKILASLSDAAFLTALAQVPAIKTGRPATHK